MQGVNSADAIRLAFDELDAAGGVHGRKIRYIVEDNQYQVPRAVRGMNKLINNDGVFFTIEDGGTPMNNATFPMAIEKNVPKLLPLPAARSMFEPFRHPPFIVHDREIRLRCPVVVGGTERIAGAEDRCFPTPWPIDGSRLSARGRWGYPIACADSGSIS